MQPKGDKVQVVTNVVTEDGTEQETFGEEFVIEKDGGEITELPLSGKNISMYLPRRTSSATPSIPIWRPSR